MHEHDEGPRPIAMEIEPSEPYAILGAATELLGDGRRQRVEGDDPVDAVEELGPEESPQLALMLISWTESVYRVLAIPARSGQ